MKRAKKISLIIAICLIVLIFVIFSVSVSLLHGITKNERFDSDRLIDADLTIEVYDKDNNIISDTNMFNNKYIKLSDLQPHTVNAFISIEDKTFYKHKGVNLKRMAKAMIRNISSGKAKEGASTISQQLIKNTHLSNEKTYSRKIKEIFLARKMEQQLSKKEILENYFNIIYFGNNIYGIENASKFYFSKPATELTLGESSVLAALIKSPANYCPINHPNKCLQRRNLVLSEMKRDGLISEDEYATEIANELQINIDINFDNGQNSYSQSAIDEAIGILKMPAKQIAIGGFKIYTYQNKDKQESLKKAIDGEGLAFDTAGISINNESNGIEAFCGNSPYSILKAKRQPGSTIKPLLVYGPAMNENIISPATKILDDKININGYQPKNFSKTYSGYISVREAISKSVNIPAVKTLSYLGVEKAKSYGKRFGIEFDEKDVGYAIALGGMTYGINIKTLASAYSAFAKNGFFTPARFISKIVDKNGNTVYEHSKIYDQVLRDDANYLTLSTLITAAKEGTAKRLSGLPYMVAAKTGTVGTDANTDAYNVALTSEDTVAIWVGNLSGGDIGNVTGGIQPTNITKNYFTEIYKRHTPKDFESPSSIEELEIDALELENNHIVLKANDFTPERFKIKEVFSRFNPPKDKSTNFLDIKPATLSGHVQNKNNVLQFDAKNYLIYDLYKKEKDKKVLLKTYSGEEGLVTFTEPTSTNSNTKYFIVTRIINYATNEELVSDESNIVEIISSDKKVVNSTPINKWYI